MLYLRLKVYDQDIIPGQRKGPPKAPNATDPPLRMTRAHSIIFF